ncbi:MAG: LLM class flavin-dependent oxidoreductase [Deltaproteobacteria bacterium]|nr:LLM class flavin-dependent oxidoreductase [Deltaproteobacteria bacterium]
MRIPEHQVLPKPVQKPHPPMWVACTQPATLEFAADHGIGALGFGIGRASPMTTSASTRSGSRTASR